MDQLNTHENSEENQFRANLQKVVSEAIHECNNHITAILTTCDILLINPSVDLLQKKLPNIKNRGVMLGRTIKSMATFSKLDNAEKVQIIDLKTLFENIAEQFLADMQKNKIVFTLELAANIQLVTQFNKLQFVVSELIKNSIEALLTSEKKEIHISVAQVEGKVIIIFTDTGERLNETTTSNTLAPEYNNKNRSLDVNLTLTKAIVQVLGGEFTFDIKDNKNYFILSFNSHGNS